jgi:flagellin-specific chaperone FliS
MKKNVNDYQRSNLKNKSANEKCSFVYHRLQYFLQNCHESVKNGDHMAFYINSNRIIDVCTKMSVIFSWEPSLGEEYKDSCRQWDKYFISLLLMVNKYIANQDDKNYTFLMEHFKVIEQNWLNAKIPESIREKEQVVVAQTFDNSYA